MYPRTSARTRGDSWRTVNTRLTTFADRPLLLWQPFSTVHTVLRGSRSALACSFRVKKPAPISAFAIARILADWRAFIAAREGDRCNWYELVRSLGIESKVDDARFAKVIVCSAR